MRRTFAGPSIRRERLAKSEVMCIFQLPFRNSYSLNGAGSTAGLLFAMCRASARGLPSDGTRMRRPQSCLATTRCLPESRHTSSFLESSAESSSGYSVLTHSSSDCGVLLCSAAGSCGCTRHLWEYTRYLHTRHLASSKHAMAPQVSHGNSGWVSPWPTVRITAWGCVRKHVAAWAACRRSNGNGIIGTGRPSGCCDSFSAVPPYCSLPIAWRGSANRATIPPPRLLVASISPAPRACWPCNFWFTYKAFSCKLLPILCSESM